MSSISCVSDLSALSNANSRSSSDQYSPVQARMNRSELDCIDGDIRPRPSNSDNDLVSILMRSISFSGLFRKKTENAIVLF